MMKKEYVMPTVVVLSVQLGKMLIPSLNVDDDEIVDDQGAKSYEILTDDEKENEILGDRRYLGEKRFDGIVRLWED